MRNFLLWIEISNTSAINIEISVSAIYISKLESEYSSDIIKEEKLTFTDTLSNYSGYSFYSDYSLYSFYSLMHN